MLRLILILLIFNVSSCQKELTEQPARAEDAFVEYLIKAGEHYSNHAALVAFQGQELAFTVKFDHSAMYTTRLPHNRLDINKLVGFSDNDQHHHLFSARFGWRYTNNELTLHAYVYNNGVQTNSLLSTIEIGKEYNCSIKAKNDKYDFSINGKVRTMPRAATTPEAQGYKLFPYFGGDETAPHDIKILIK